MNRSMPTPAAPRRTRLPDCPAHLQAAPTDADPERLEPLRALCHELAFDLPAVQRHMLALIVLHAHSRQDIAGLRAPLFDALARSLGERVARERVARLDAALEA